SRATPECLQDDRVDLLDTVDAVLQVLLPGPTRERVRKLAVVPERGKPLPELRGQLVVDIDPHSARRRPEDLVVQHVDAAQLLDRALVVFDPELDDDVGQARVASVALDDEERRRLLPAAVASSLLRRRRAG